jgi:cation-transporting ATPase E
MLNVTVAHPRAGPEPPWVTPEQGLTATEVADRLERGQANDTGQATSRPLKDIIRANVITPFNGLLGGLAVVVLFTGYWQDALFGFLIVFNSGVGVIQELRVKRTLDRLAVLSAPRARVVRDGTDIEIATSQVVLDDLLQLRTGDQVPADGSLVTVDGLEVDESLLTGESEPVAKEPGDAVLSGSIVVAGRGRCQVSAVGAESFAAKLTAEARQFTTTKSELVRGINEILRYVTIAVVVLGPILYASQARATSTWQEAVRGTIAGLVGMVPEGLVLLTSIAFFAAALALARRRVLVQELPAVEGLARVDVVCVDKTGTLTEGDVEFEGVEQLDAHGASVAPALGALAAQPDANATLLAIRDAFPSGPGWARTAAVPFSSARKWSAATFEGQGTWVLGAPEMVQPHTGPDDPVRVRSDELAATGARTLLLAHADAGPSGLTAQQLPAGLEPVALLTFAEKVRPDATDTLRYFADQGVAVKVISGDNPRTVGAIARRVGLPAGDAVDLRQYTDQPMPDDLIEQGSVFGRVTPHQKRAIVAGLQARGHTVAMTGDGVNDALALKDADIGVAMGSGAAATRAVAQLVLLDSEFSVMPGVVAEGRRIIANVERVANLFLTKNVTSVVLALSVAIARWPFPFLPRHVTMVSELTIGIPGFFLALGPNPRRFHPGFVRRVLAFAVPAGVISAVAVMVGYAVGRANGAVADEARTAATVVLLLISMWVLVIQARPLRLWKVLLVAAMAGLVVLAFVLPVGQHFYSLHIPSASVAGQCVVIGAAGALGVELVSRAGRRLGPARARSTDS